MFIKLFKKSFFSLSLLFAFFSWPVFAVDVFFAGSGAGSSVVALMIDTKEEKVNSISGVISYDPQKTKVVSITEGNSPFTLWLEKDIKEELGQVAFAIISPGGFSGVAPVLSINLESASKSPAPLSLGKVEILRNDGLGTKLKSNFLSRPPESLEKYAFNINIDTDKIAPELFVPLVSRDNGLLGGGRYLFFNTVDKGSGVEGYYLIKKFIPLSLDGNLDPDINRLSWQKVDSPFLLKDRIPHAYYYLKATDRAGNSLIVGVPGLKPFYSYWQFWFIIILVSLITIWLKRKSQKY